MPTLRSTLTCNLGLRESETVCTLNLLNDVPVILKVGKDLRVEWARSLARAERWEEEVLMLKVEMNRVLHFMKEKADWWRRSALAREGAPMDILAEIIAYAQKQAYIREELGKKFAAEWAGIYKAHDKEVPRYWPLEFRNVTPVPRQIVRRGRRTIAHGRILVARQTSTASSST